jgi:hypothetical protein
MRQGLYKVEYHTVHGAGCGVIYATSGKLRGGNSAFFYSGTYSGEGDAIQIRVTTARYNPDPSFKSLFGVDMVTLALRGKNNGAMLDFEGNALQFPGVDFKAILTRIGD